MSIYAVNGKMPIAAWIPSRDDAGNGTTTLTDLVGSNNGTLTNMDAASDWVADTGAGGVRALDFDGANDFVSLGVGTVGTLVNGSSAVSFAMWINIDNYIGTATQTGANIAFVTLRQSNVASLWLNIRNDVGNVGKVLIGGRSTNADAFQSATSTTAIALDTWAHVGGVLDFASDTIKVYVNGVLETTGNVAFGSSSFVYAAGTSVDSIVDLASRFDGRIDDLRIWDQALDATEIAYLYNNGFGRGIQNTSALISNRRRRSGRRGGTL